MSGLCLDAGAVFRCQGPVLDVGVVFDALDVPGPCLDAGAVFRCRGRV